MHMEVRVHFGRFVCRGVNIDDVTIHLSRGSSIKYIWTKYGVTHLKERDGSPIIIIKSKKDLVKHGTV